MQARSTRRYGPLKPYKSGAYRWPSFTSDDLVLTDTEGTPLRLKTSTAVAVSAHGLKLCRVGDLGWCWFEDRMRRHGMKAPGANHIGRADHAVRNAKIDESAAGSVRQANRTHKRTANTIRGGIVAAIFRAATIANR